jgi:hypothetical protein
MRETLMPDATQDDLARQLAVFRTNLANMQSWQPTPSASRIPTSRRKKARPSSRRPRNSAGFPWRRRHRNPPRPRNHSTMLDAPNVCFIANAINRRLSESQQAHNNLQKPRP